MIYESAYAWKSVKIEAQARMPSVEVDVVQMELCAPVDQTIREDANYRLELSLTPRPFQTRLCYTDRWPAHRLEKAGKLFLLPPRENLRLLSVPGGAQTMIICQCHPELFEDVLDGDFELTDRHLDASFDLNNRAISRLLCEMAAEARHPGFASALMIEALGTQLAVHLSRDLIRLAKGGDCGGLAPWRLRAIDERLLDMAAPPTLVELARICRLSVRQLSRAFQISRGQSLGAYVAFRRIEAAKALLARGSSVKAAAYRLGFSSSSSFGYAFRRETGVSPREFKLRGH